MTPPRMTRTSLLSLLLLLGACGPEGPHLLWSKDASALDNPFPDARLLEASGTGAHFRDGWYYPFLPSFPHRLNAWKKQPLKVDLASSGGHRVDFPEQARYQ